MLLLSALLTGCRTAPELSQINFSEPGWKVRQGQAVWRADHNGLEIAGDLLVATHTDGRTLVQFTKTPIQIVLAQTSPSRWWLQHPPNDTFDGYGPPPSRVIWLHLARFLDGAPLPARWQAQRKDSSWRIENPRTGEILEGFVSP